MQHRARGELDPEIRLANDLRIPVFRLGDGGFQVGIRADLELHLLDDRVEVSLVRRSHKAQSAARDESVVQRVGGQVDRLAGIAAIQVDDVGPLAAQVLGLVIPENAARSVAVVQIRLTP